MTSAHPALWGKRPIDPAHQGYRRSFSQENWAPRWPPPAVIGTPYCIARVNVVYYRSPIASGAIRDWQSASRSQR